MQRAWFNEGKLLVTRRTILGMYYKQIKEGPSRKSRSSTKRGTMRRIEEKANEVRAENKCKVSKSMVFLIFSFSHFLSRSRFQDSVILGVLGANPMEGQLCQHPIQI